MNSNIRAIGAALGLAMAAVIGVASFAWACTVQAHVSGLSPEEGPAGTKVTVTAENFEPGEVQIRWNGTTGPLLGTATGPAFSVTVTIPDVVPDTYSIVAIKRTGDSIVGKASAAFEVLPGSVVESGGYRSSSGSSTQPSGGTEAGQTSSASTSRSRSANTAPPEEPVGSATTARAGQSQASTASAGQSQASTAPGSSSAEAAEFVTAQPVPATTRGGDAVARRRTAGVGATESRSAPVAATLSPPGSDEEQMAPSPRTAWGDLGSGFASGGPARGASLIDTAPAAGTGRSPATVGMLALSIGVVALLAGFGVAEARRPRAIATRSADK